MDLRQRAKSPWWCALNMRILPRPASPRFSMGMLENIVYFGTDTHYHVQLADGRPFIVRQQSSRTGGESFAVGAMVGISLERDAAHLLRD